MRTCIEMLRFLIFQFLFELSTSTPGESWSCGYNSCPQAQKDVLNVHIVPHTHDDLGWLKTVDQYYYGSRNDIQKAGVQYILNSVVKELWADPKRTFIYAEMAFFWKWWLQQSDSVKDKVHILVQQGRLKFVGGAWSMNDEAVTHYQNIIDQFTFGLKKINDTFGPCATPRVAWQIDSFGHSKEFASLLAAMGYDGLLIGRIDFQDKRERMQKKTMEMIWRGDDDLGSASDIFTGVLYNLYHPPQGFCFDVLCNDEPIIDDIESPMYNLDRKIADFFKHIYKQAKAYRTKNILLTMGGDFHFQDAGMWYKNLDKLIKYSNKKAAKDYLNVTLLYSTPDCYLKAVKDSDPFLPTKQDDFFPYASGEHSYWTGYYTSRPLLKYFERDISPYVQMAKQLHVLANLNESSVSTLDELKGNLGVLQHHQAVTGTQRQNVTYDFANFLSKAGDESLNIASQALSKMTTGKSDSPIFNFKKCHLNQSECIISENSENFIFTLYNPLSWKLSWWIEIPVTYGNYEVYGPNGELIKSELSEISYPILQWLQDLPQRQSNATHFLTIQGLIAKPLSYQIFYIRKLPYHEKNKSIPFKEVLKNNSFSFDYDHTFSIYACLYNAMTGNNSEERFRSSGAYILRPESTEPEKCYDVSAFMKHKIFKENESISGQLTYFLPAINVRDGFGKELVLRHRTSKMNSNGEFYTDSNGRQLIKRINNQRPQYNMTSKEPVAGNYYPANNRIVIHDDEMRYTIFPDRPCGVRSPKDGILEVLFDRRLLHDDGIGLNESLNEMENGKGLARITNFIWYYRNHANIIEEKRIAMEFKMPIFMFSDAKNINIREWLKLKNSGSALNKDLPLGLHLLTLEHWDKGKLLLRLENYLEKSDRTETTIEIDISNVFRTLIVKSFKETTLAANQWLADSNKIDWNKENEFVRNFNEDYGRFGKRVMAEDIYVYHERDEFSIKLQAKQIRTFIVEYEVKIE